MLLFRYAKDVRRFANKPETWFLLGVAIMGVAIWQMFT